MSTVTARVPLMGDVFTQEALDGLAGQTPRLTLGFDQTQPVGRATIVKAEQEGEWLLLTLDFDEATAERLFSGFDGEPDHYGMGFTLPDAEMLDPDKGTRRFKDVKVHEVSPRPEFPGPAFPKGS